MTELELRIDGTTVEPSVGWSLAWLDVTAGIVRVTDGSRSELCIVEGSGSDWVVTLRGRRIPVTVRSWRERVFAEAESAAARSSGPVEVRATLPGLIAAVAVADGDEVSEGASLLTIEAMKMQNEVRAPRGGRVVDLSAVAGTTVAAGTTLLRIE